MSSLRAKIIKKILKLSVSGKKYDYNYVLKRRKFYNKSLDSFLVSSEQRQLDWIEIDGVRATWVIPIVNEERTIIYVHGGGFVFGLSALHMNYVEHLAETCKARVLVIDYKLSPEVKYPIALNEILAVWKNLIESGLDNSKTVFMGDSAGANLALAASLKIRDNGFAQPACLVLACPSFDATFSGMSYKNNTDKDPVLTIDELEYFFDSYLGDADRNDPLISPIFADLHDLPPFLVSVGTEEVLLSDSIALKQNAKRDGADMSLFIGDGMWHNWQLSKKLTPESKKAIKVVTEYIISKTA